jgi:hypothetical protein
VRSVCPIRTSTDGEVLSFAAVGFHGREWWTRLASSALMFLLAVAPAWSQPAYFQDFASRIVAAIPPGATVRLVCTGDDGPTLQDLARLLSARGVRLSETADGTTTVRCSCLENLRERACVADIGDGSARRVVVTAHPRDRAEPLNRDPIVGLELRPIYAQRDPILDIAVADGGLLVLTPTMLTMVPADAKGATAAPAPSQFITTARVWPRDLRGRVRTTAGGFEVFLPGVTCRGTTTPFTLACADESDAWPIGLENAGIAPSRNTFATPEGLLFYEAAPLGDQRWLVVDQQGVLTFLDSHRRVVAKGDAADHAVALRASCAPDSYVATTARPPDAESADVVLLSRMSGDRLVLMASTLVLPGTLTALWPTADDRAATAIVHNARSGRYEAFHLSLSCTR